MKEIELIDECRDNGVPCGRSKCSFHDAAFSQSCSCLTGIIEHVLICKEYEPVEGSVETLVKKRNAAKEVTTKKKMSVLNKWRKRMSTVLFDLFLFAFTVFAVLWMKGRSEAVELEKELYRFRIERESLEIQLMKRQFKEELNIREM